MTSVRSPARPDAPPPSGGEHRAVLKKELRRFGFFALAFGSMIGVGWVTAIGSWLSQAGPGGTIVAFLVGGGVMLCIGFCYAELTPMLPVAGGEVAYAYKAFGMSKAFVVGWTLAFGYVSISGFEAISIGRVLSYLFPSIDRWPLYSFLGSTVYGSHLLLAAVFTGLITWVNWVGAKSAARLQVALTVLFLTVTAVFVVAGFSTGRVEYMSPLFVRGAGGGIAAGLLSVLVTIPFWFVGFDTIPQGAEEASVQVTARSLAFMILGSIVAATAFYILVILAVSMVGPWAQIVDADLPAARAFEFAFTSAWLPDMVLVAALLGLFTSWNGFFLAGSRVVFALGRGRLVPPAFGETHARHGTPYNAVLLVGVLTMSATLMGRDALVALVDAGSFCIAVAFFGVSMSAMRLRRDYPDIPRPFRMPGGRVIPLFAALGSLCMVAAMLVPGSPAALVWPHEHAVLLVMVVVGAGLWRGARTARNALPESQREFLVLG